MVLLDIFEKHLFYNDNLREPTGGQCACMQGFTSDLVMIKGDHYTEAEARWSVQTQMLKNASKE